MKRIFVEIMEVENGYQACVSDDKGSILFNTDIYPTAGEAGEVALAVAVVKIDIDKNTADILKVINNQ